MPIRPCRYGRAKCLLTMPSRPRLEACLKTTGPLPAKCSVRRMPSGGLLNSLASAALRSESGRARRGNRTAGASLIDETRCGFPRHGRRSAARAAEPGRLGNCGHGAVQTTLPHAFRLSENGRLPWAFETTSDCRIRCIHISGTCGRFLPQEFSQQCVTSHRKWNTGSQDQGRWPTTCGCPLSASAGRTFYRKFASAAQAGSR
jgi:hypothetical protein